ncbi:SCO family protein [bacterium]|nr:MAG: SCO family protein [bacterium]
MRRLVLPILALPALAAAQGYNMPAAYDAAEVARDPEAAKIGIEQRLGQPVMGFANFQDDTGKRVQLKELLGKRPILLLPIFYACTGACNLELTGVVDALNQSSDLKVGRDFDIVALGIHPKETPALARNKKLLTLRTLKGKTDAGAWRFLTGDEESTRAVTDSLGFKYTYDEGKDRVNHPAAIMVITPKGMISSYILGARYSSTQLRGYLATAAKEEVGQKAKTILMGCVHLDPVTGKRSIVIEGVLRLFGVVTLLSMAVWFGALTGKRWWEGRGSRNAG